MTTIAWKDGVIAYDGRASSGGTILTDDLDKAFRRPDTDLIFVCTGNRSDVSTMIEDYLYQRAVDRKEFTTAAIILHPGGKVSWLSVNEDTGEWQDLPLDGPMLECGALGSGRDHALTAMDMGASAVEAVEMAAKRDIYTGGTVRSIRFSDFKKSSCRLPLLNGRVP